jgi:hypothetical protein
MAVNKTHFLQRLTISILLVLPGQWQSIKAAPDQDIWSAHAAKGSYLHKCHRPGESLQEYRNAIALLTKDPTAPKYLLVDLQLSAVQVMAESGQFHEAEVVLNEIKANNTLLKQSLLLNLRYWRRVAFLRRQQQDYANAAKAQQQVLALAEQAFGKTCPVAAEETKQLLDYQTMAGQWMNAVDTAGKLYDLQRKAEPLPLSNTYKQWLSYFEPQLLDRVTKLAATGTAPGIKEASRLMQSYCRCAPKDSKFFWTYWQNLIQVNLPIARELQAENCWFILKAVKLSDASAAQLALLNAAATSLFFHRIHQERKVDTVSEELGNTALSAQERMWTPKQRTGVTQYIQTASMQAYVLVKNGKIREGEALIDKVVLDPCVFKDQYILDGIFQARCFALAHHYERHKNADGVRNQFKQLYKTLDSLPNLKDKAKLYKEWKRCEAGYVQRAQ